jgi:hypothetical protein
LIISASRRTDIPALYSEWFVNRIRAGYCTVPNPFNRKQISYVSLYPEDVEAIVLWTRNPQPLIPHLKELEQRGHRFYFQYTVMDNPRSIDTKTPALPSSLKTFQSLSDLIGPERVVWRYDPIVFSTITGARFHADTFERIAKALRGYTFRAVISVLDVYPKAHKRLRELKEKGVEIVDYRGTSSQRFDELMYALANAAAENKMEIVSCAETIDLRPYGIHPGKCIDDDLIEKVFEITTAHKKDPFQRQVCGCVVSKDIGMYDTCVLGCQYCYATSSFERARINYGKHDPESPSLMGWYEIDPSPQPHQAELL